MTTLRLLGSELDEPELFVDATLDEVDLDGVVHLTEGVDTDPRSWQLHVDTLDELRADNLAAKHSDLSDPTHDVWTTLSELHDHADDTALTDIDATVETNAQSVYRNVVRAMQ